MSFDPIRIIEYAATGNIAKINEILDNDPSHVDLYQAFWTAINNERLEIIRLLLQRAPNTSNWITNKVIRGSATSAILQELVNHGWEIEFNESGERSLRMFKCTLNSVKWVLERGTNPNNSSTGHSSVLSDTCLKGAGDESHRIIRLLRENGAELEEKALFNSLDGRFGAGILVLKDLLDWGLDPNSRSERWGPILNYAIYTGRLNSVKLLLERGADPSLPSKSGLTAAEYAKVMGSNRISDYITEFQSSKEQFNGPQ